MQEDLARRWLLARRAALRSVIPEADADAPEMELLLSAWGRDPEASLRRVFDNSHALGLSFRRYHRVDLTLGDLAALLPALGAPCHQGGFHQGADPLTRRAALTPCAPGSASPTLCVYWREATAGLSGGLASAVYYTRLESPYGHGASCLDLLHVDAESLERYQPLPEAMLEPLREAAASLGRVIPNSEAEFLGLIEGELHVRLRSKSPPCGLDPFLVLQRSLRSALPGLVVRDASPRSVLGDPS